MSVEIYATLGEPHEIAATLSDLRYLVFQGLKGDTGDSAYEEAVKLGFYGTEEEWLASLKGEAGANGRDGHDGAPGVPGRDGVSPTVQTSTITGGHRVTITDAEHPSGQTFDVMDGEDGVSPTVTVADIAGGHRVTITDATHPQGQSFDVLDGEKGDTGTFAATVTDGLLEIKDLSLMVNVAEVGA